jgi:excisionase family DNA binding protein
MNANPCKIVSEFEPLLNVREVAKLFGVNHSTLLRMARSGHLPGVKIAGCGDFESANSIPG